MNTLSQLEKEYKLNNELYTEISRCVQYNHRKK